MALDEPIADEVPTPINGLDILISEDVKGFAERAVVDYVNSAYGKGFTINTGSSSC